MNVITQSEAANLIRQSGGKLFGVTFLTRGKGNLRRMTARTGVRKGTTGEGQKFNARDLNLITVHEFVTDEARDARGRYRNLTTQFRNVAIEGITRLKVGGTEYDVVPDTSGDSPF
jgi:hypothetical protein